MTICDICESRNPTTRCDVKMTINAPIELQPSDSHFDLCEECLPLFWGAQFLIGMRVVWNEQKNANKPRVMPARHAER